MGSSLPDRHVTTEMESNIFDITRNNRLFNRPTFFHIFFFIFFSVYLCVYFASIHLCFLNLGEIHILSLTRNSLHFYESAIFLLLLQLWNAKTLYSRYGICCVCTLLDTRKWKLLDKKLVIELNARAFSQTWSILEKRAYILYYILW